MGKRSIRTEYIKKEHIQGNLNVIVDISDQRSIDEQMKRKEKIGGLEKAFAMNPQSMDMIEVQKEVLRLAGYDNVDIWFPQAQEEVMPEEEEMPTEAPTGMPTGMPEGMPTEMPTGEEEASPVVEGLKGAGAFTQQRPGFMGGIADKIRSMFGGGK